MNEILNKFEDIKQENVSLKRNLKEKLKMISNLDKDSCDVTNNSFFKEISKDQSKSKIKLVQEKTNNEKVKREDINLDESNESKYKFLTNNKRMRLKLMIENMMKLKRD